MIDYFLESYFEDFPIARKSHFCFECRGLINKKEKYASLGGFGPDGPERFKLCVDCYHLLFDLNSEIRNFDEKIAFGELIESITETEDEGSLMMKRLFDILIKRNSPYVKWSCFKEYGNHTNS